MSAGRWIGLGLALAPLPAQAECMGGCLDGLVAALASMAVYALIGIVLLVMLIRAKWRRAGLWSLAVVAGLALGVPLASQAWVGWQLRSVEARELVGTPPPMTGRVPLLITPDGNCQYSACEAVLLGRGAAGAYVVSLWALDGLDLTQPVALADVPLEHWALSVPGQGEAPRRVLTAEERRLAAGQIDYLILTSWPYRVTGPERMDIAVQGNPALKGAGQDAVIRLALAPLEPGAGTFNLKAIRFDLLDLTLARRPLAIPLAPLNDQEAGNTPVGLEVAAKAICPDAGLLSDCLSLLDP